MDKHFVAKSDTPEGDKDLWRTPIELFRALDREFVLRLMFALITITNWRRTTFPSSDRPSSMSGILSSMSQLS